MANCGTISCQLKFEVRGNMKFGYFYDALGNLTAIQYHAADGNSYTYYVATNSMGDVILICNSKGRIFKENSIPNNACSYIKWKARTQTVEGEIQLSEFFVFC